MVLEDALEAMAGPDSGVRMSWFKPQAHHPRRRPPIGQSGLYGKNAVVSRRTPPSTRSARPGQAKRRAMYDRALAEPDSVAKREAAMKARRRVAAVRREAAAS